MRITALLAGAASLAAPLTVTAHAQEAGPAKFTTAEAAACGAVFASLVQAFQVTEGVPEETRRGATVGLMFWEYELAASAPGQDAVVERTVLAAFDALNADMPAGEDEAAANARGDHLMREARSCSARIDAAYPEGVHPIATQLRQVAEAEAAVPAPSLSPQREDAQDQPQRKPTRLR